MRRVALIAALAMLAGCEAGDDAVAWHPADALPDRLSAWNLLLSDGERLRLNGAAMPYDLNVPLFSDYALKLRTVYVPGGKTALYRESGVLDFPVGTILSKTFHYRYGDRAFRKLDAEAQLEAEGSLDLTMHRVVETRLLVHYADGWRAMPYVWNDEQTMPSSPLPAPSSNFASPLSPTSISPTWCRT
jgi:hypothetical protein